MTKFGFCETFFIFEEFDRLDLVTYRDFSSKAFRCALKQGVISLPRGFFESVFSFAVAIADDVDTRTADAIRNETPPKHWASAEIPVIYDRSTRQLIYFERTPFWGAAYFSGFRKQIQHFLGSL